MAIQIVETQHGYFALYVDGIFEGNFDTYAEAMAAADELRN